MNSPITISGSVAKMIVTVYYLRYVVVSLLYRPIFGIGLKVCDRARANPYDPRWELYFEQREAAAAKMAASLKGRNFLLTLWQQQRGRGAHCRDMITPETRWRDHHKLSRLRGGTDARGNHVLLHPNCHMTVHHAWDSLCKPHSVTRVFGKA